MFECLIDRSKKFVSRNEYYGNQNINKRTVYSVSPIRIMVSVGAGLVFDLISSIFHHRLDMNIVDVRHRMHSSSRHMLLYEYLWRWINAFQKIQVSMCC